MSARMATSTETVVIYIPLLDEGTEVLRPTSAVVVGPNQMRVLATKDYDRSLEKWQFPPGATVSCEKEHKDGRELLVARRQIA